MTQLTLIISRSRSLVIKPVASAFQKRQLTCPHDWPAAFGRRGLCPSDGSPLRFPPRNLQRRRLKRLADEAFGLCAAGTGHETLAREQRSRESQTLFTYLDNISIRCRLDRKEPQTSSVIRDPPVCNSTMTICCALVSSLAAQFSPRNPDHAGRGARRSRTRRARGSFRSASRGESEHANASS